MCSTGFWRRAEVKILAIRGANLASLAAPFEVDLSSGPLASAGLFAITGETGAGKSTILDALCLALYGKYPRVAAPRQENAPDPSGEAISVHDGRAILRRGAGSGYAEVDFIGQDGEGYRVRWEANRARGRAIGRLQPEQRALFRLSDGSAVAAGKTQVREAVEARTDLTFDQFRRTVLLAQGEFDAFLLAPENERAELLEKITGTEIYAAISVRVHEGTETRRRSVLLLEQRREATGLLDSAGRLLLVDEQVDLSGSIALKAAERTQHSARLDHFRRVATARQNMAQAEAQIEAAAAMRAAASADYSTLSELDAVEPMRPLATELRNGRRAVTELETRLGELRDTRSTSLDLDAAAKLHLDAASVAHGASEAELRRLEPIWTAAEKLDAELSGARTESDAASKAAAEAEVAREKHRASLAELDETISRTQQQLTAAETELEARSHQAILADRLDVAVDLLKKGSALKNERQIAHSSAGKAAGEAARLEGEIGTLVGMLAPDQTRRDVLARELSERRNAMAAIGEPALLERDATLRDAADALRQAAETCARHASASADLAHGEAELTAARRDITAADEQISAAEVEQRRDRAARTEIAPFAELADEAVSAEAAHLRSLLVPDAPCPVCGSREHPHLAHPSALNELAEKVRERRRELDASLAASALRQSEASLSRAAADVRQVAAVRKIATAKDQVALHTETYSERKPALARLCEAAGLDAGVPSPEASDAQSVLAATMASAVAERAKLAEPLARGRRLRGDVDAMQQQHDALVVGIDATTKTLDTHRATLQSCQLEGREYAVRGSELDERLTSIDREIAPFLAAAGLSTTGLEPAKAIARLSATAKEFGDLRGRVDELHRTAQRLAPERAAAAASAATSVAQTTEARRHAELRRATLEEKVSARAQLLNGEETDAHRKRINDAHAAVRTKLAGSSEARSAAAAALQAAVGRHDEVAGALETAVAQRATAEKSFVAACAAAGRAIDLVTALLATDPAVVGALRSRISAIETASSDAQAGAAVRRSDLALALEGYDEATDAEALAAAIELLGTEIGGLHQRSGVLSATLQRDDEARLAASSLSGEIEAAGADLSAWQAVNDAIGSASGDRFRRFAQGITLDHMVQLANEHLGGLSPRYRLARGTSADLTLHVVDRDMGDEVRGTRSLSGGERFLVSLALALALSSLEGRSSFVDTLFIDEGFGSLDAETLGVAIDALETLQGRGQKVGVITHVAAMIERIAVQVRVEKRGAGRSEVRIHDGFGIM